MAQMILSVVIFMESMIIFTKRRKVRKQNFQYFAYTIFLPRKYGGKDKGFKVQVVSILRVEDFIYS